MSQLYEKELASMLTWKQRIHNGLSHCFCCMLVCWAALAFPFLEWVLVLCFVFSALLLKIQVHAAYLFGARGSVTYYVRYLEGALHLQVKKTGVYCPLSAWRRECPRKEPLKSRVLAWPYEPRARLLSGGDSSPDRRLASICCLYRMHSEKKKKKEIACGLVCAMGDILPFRL